MSFSDKWTVIAVTCSNIESAHAVQKELEVRQKKGSISKDTIVLAVDDPKPLIGSGSATLNALLLIAQYLSTRAGMKTIDPNVLNGARILIIHMGRQSALSPCGSAFITLPMQLNTKENSDTIQGEVCCNIDLLLFTLSNMICVDSPPGVWVTSCDMILSVPFLARVDLSGGWSDTPPITYEHGGIVTNVAIKIDGNRPIGAKIRKIPEPKLILMVGRGEECLPLICNTLEDIRDFSNPSAPGALLKSAFLCTNTVTLSSQSSLESQLQNRYGCGFELHTWSDLPQGSGLGTSSILAGVICAAILRILGRNLDDTTIIHLVVQLEQMLTTGGGWQDQVGGLLPGVKITTSPAEIPIMVKPVCLNVSSETLNKVAQHTALIYTGKTRLAKYILQDVIRRWYARSPEILRNVDELTRNAEACAVAWQQGDIEKMGHCLNLYREQKKIMAPGCEPHEIREIIDAIQPYLHACCLAGAGGGGFLFVITKKPNIHEQLTTMLKSIKKEKNLYTVHRVEIDNEGMTVRVNK